MFPYYLSAYTTDITRSMLIRECESYTRIIPIVLVLHVSFLFSETNWASKYRVTSILHLRNTTTRRIS